MPTKSLLLRCPRTVRNNNIYNGFTQYKLQSQRHYAQIDMSR